MTIVNPLLLLMTSSQVGLLGMSPARSPTPLPPTSPPPPSPPLLPAPPSLPPPTPPPLGVRCAAMSSNDSLWYRAEIESVQLTSPSYANVFYTDYGKPDTVTLGR